MNPEIPVGIKIENLLLDCENASVFDFKMGTSTIHKEQKGETLKKRIITDLETTTASLGIRIAGIKVLDSETGEVYEKVSHTKSLYKEEKIKKNLNTAFTAHGKLWVQGIDKVITVLQDMIEQWPNLKARLINSSVLIIVDPVLEVLKIHLIDITYIEEQDAVDEGFIKGL